MVGQCKGEYNLQDGWIFLCYKADVENLSVCSRRLKEKVLLGHTLLMGQEKYIKILLIHRLGILIQSTDISWKGGQS